MAKILITGGAGFIGSHLCEALLERGDKVFVLDDLSTGSEKNLASFRGSPNFSFEKGTILDPETVRNAVSQSDFVFHLAAAVGAKLVTEKPLDSFLTNIKGTENVFTSAAEKKIPVLFASSSEIYGKNEELPFREEDDRIYGSVYNYRWGYAFSKGVDEFLALAYFKEKALPVVVVRLFNVIGPRQTGSYGMVLPNFINQALSGQNLLIHGDGSQTRCFINVKDAVRGLVGLMESKNAFGEVFNLGTEEEISIKDLAMAVKRIAKSESSLDFVPHSQVYGPAFEEMNRRKPSIKKIEAVIGFKPKFSLEQSIDEMVEIGKKTLVDNSRELSYPER